MNSMKELEEIITDYREKVLLKVIRTTGTMTPIQRRHMNQAAAKRTREIKKQLSNLKLPPEDCESFPLLLSMMDEFINCFEANAKGHLDKALLALAKADAARNDYLGCINPTPLKDDVK